MKKVNYNKNRTILFFSMVLTVVIAFMAIPLIDAGVAILDILGVTSPGLCYGVMSLIGNIEGTSDKDSSGAQITMRVWLIERRQLNLSIPFPAANASREISSIPLKPGEHMHYIECIDGSQDNKSSGAKDDITTVVTNTFTMIVGGNKNQILDFIEQHAGDAFIIIYQMADDRAYYILGNDLKPLYLNAFERGNNKTNRSVSLTFGNQNNQQPYKYTGAIIEAPPTVLADGATNLAINTARQYESGANAAATTIATLSGITGTDVGRTIEVVGGGGNNPSIISSTTNIILKDDEDWIANVGSKIVFRILDTTTLVELSRIQTS